MKRLKPIMFVGTGSDVGKSVINAAFCRIFKQDGYNPAPFKAQNMSLNSYATKSGHEIGRAQAMQSEACGLECLVEMNPILLKPVSNQHAQVVLNGKAIGNQSAAEYFNQTDRGFLFDEAMKSLNTLKSKFNPIVIEGAGSISEMNLWDRDITNMRVAKEIKASTFLIADIDKGGVFASVYGSIHLLPEEERELIKGIIINKFRGDLDLFKDGIQIIEKICGKPVVGVIPHFRDIQIDQEDSVVLDSKTRKYTENKINVAVVLLPHLSNFTDFNLLERYPGVNLYYTANPDDLAFAHIIILPGTKNTIDDLMFLRNQGLAKAILNAHDKGKMVYGICGGFQMMGTEISDPHHVESKYNRIPGLGILPVKTVLLEEKVTRQCYFSFLNTYHSCTGYEIHMGETVSEHKSPLCIMADQQEDGYFLNEKTWGTYIHGIFDNEDIIKHILTLLNVNHLEETGMDMKGFREEQFDKLAGLVRNNVNLKYIYETIGL